MSMQREEILKRIAEIDSELKKRKESNRLNFYNTGRKKHKKQIAFHKCKKRNRWVFGGNRSGKTECGAVECLWMLRGIHPYRKNRFRIYEIYGKKRINIRGTRFYANFQGSKGKVRKAVLTAEVLDDF